MALFSIFLVGYSLVRGNRPEPEAHPDSYDGRFLENDDPALGDIFDAIRTLELEYQLGRLPQEEFDAQFQTYRVEAATVLRDQLEAGRGDPAWLLEHDILLARGAQDPASVRLVPCPDCSASVPQNQANCPHCGAEMVPQP
ncbi:MAG: hypothetical protein O2913_01080 [Chloroflexi bacterium]|nr:hypothetical protein [Chloroflexota bacterium]